VTYSNRCEMATEREVGQKPEVTRESVAVAEAEGVAHSEEQSSRVTCKGLSVIAPEQLPAASHAGMVRGPHATRCQLNMTVATAGQGRARNAPLRGHASATSAPPVSLPRA
jgi:hypothetical protein